MAKSTAKPAKPLADDPAADVVEQPATKPAPPRARQSSAPFCPYHKKTRCKAGHSDAYFTRYYCPEEGCTYSQKVARPNMPSRLHRAEDFGAR